MRRHTIHRTALAIILSLVANASPAEPRTDSRSITADIEREMTTLEKTAVLPLYQAEYILMLNETCLRASLSESSAVKLTRLRLRPTSDTDGFSRAGASV